MRLAAFLVMLSVLLISSSGVHATRNQIVRRLKAKVHALVGDQSQVGENWDALITKMESKGLSTSAHPPAGAVGVEKLGTGYYKNVYAYKKSGTIVAVVLANKQAHNKDRIMNEVAQLKQLAADGIPAMAVYGSGGFEATIDGQKRWMFLGEALTSTVNAASAKPCGTDADKQAASLASWYDGLDADKKATAKQQLQKVYDYYQTRYLVKDLQFMVDNDSNLRVVDPNGLCERYLKSGKIDLTTYPTTGPCQVKPDMKYALPDCKGLVDKFGVTAITNGSDPPPGLPTKEAPSAAPRQQHK